MTIDLKEVGSGFKRTSLNENFVDIEDAINNDLLWRDGSQPMAGSLDMNSERIINLPDAVTDQEPITLGQASAIAGIPSQAGEAGKYLTTDGASTSWGEVFPDQSGNAGKFLSTDGTDALWKNAAASYANVTEMFAGDNAVGEVYGAGGTSWRVDSISVPMTIDNYTALSEVNIAAFGAREDGSSVSAACQAAIDYAAPRGYPVRVQGTYTWDATVNVYSDTILYCDGSKNTVSTGIGKLFYADARVEQVDKVTIVGGEWIAGYDTVPDVTFYYAEGNYNSGSPIYVWRSNIDRVRLSGFNWFVEGDYHRTFNVTNSFSYGRNGIRFGYKNVEASVSQCVIFGREFGSVDTRGFSIGEGAGVSNQYCEGIKISKCTVDGHGRAVSLSSILDFNLTDNWLSSATETSYHVLYVEDDGVNTIYKGININNNTFKRGRIQFATKSAPPIVTNMQLADNLYIDAQEITIGNYWNNMSFSDWDIERIGGSSGTGIGILCAFENKNLHFNNIRFRRDWVRLISIFGDRSTGCVIDGVVCDTFMDQPFYFETLAKVNNSAAAKTPAELISYGGQVIYAGKLDAVSEGAVAFTTPTISLPINSLIQIEIHGRVNNTNASGRLQFFSTNAAAVESVTQGTGFTGRLVEMTNTSMRIDATHIWKVASTGDTELQVLAETGDLSVAGQAYVVIRYI